MSDSVQNRRRAQRDILKHGAVSLDGIRDLAVRNVFMKMNENLAGLADLVAQQDAAITELRRKKGG